MTLRGTPTPSETRATRCLLFDWGDTLMRDLKLPGPMAAWERVEAMPYAVEVLAALRPHWTLALATNATDSDEAAIWAALHRAGLGHFLDKVYCFRRIGRRKPSAEFFAYILNDLQADRARVIMIGDDFETDVLGANRAGLRATWLNERSPEERVGEMYSTIHDLRALPAALT